jgi:LAO/AO transport system kinase
VNDLVDGVLEHDRGAVARLISLVEAGGDTAAEAAARLFPHTGGVYTVGITGAPGAGKSTLTDRLIVRIRQQGDEVGVLAVDPTSPFTGGAILGDRVRMQEHATDAGVFIRSMATRGHLGGLALATPQAVRVLDAAGKPWVIVETVGVGQVEVEIAEAADTTVVVVTPGWGDGVQANKAGLLEIADVFVVNKADRAGVDETVRDLVQMLELSPPRSWQPPIVTTVAAEDRGIDDCWCVS